MQYTHIIHMHAASFLKTWIIYLLVVFAYITDN